MFDERVRAHDTLVRGVDAILGFLRDPRAKGIAPLDQFDRAAGRYGYRTDAQISVAELLAPGAPSAGVRATLELMVGVGAALQAVATRGPDAGVHAHGSLTPWRVGIATDGSVTLLGYGLPDAALYAYLDGDEPGVSLDTLRYATPERLDDVDQDVRSDLYAVALIGAGLLLGRPVFDGTAENIAERVLGGQAPELIEASGSALGDALLDLLCVAVELKPADRFRDAEEFVRQARLALADAKGPSLAELVGRVLAARVASVPAPRAPEVDDEDDPPTDVLRAPGRTARPPEPSAPPDSDEDGETEAGFDAGFELVAPVSPLPDDADLDGVRAHARSIVERARQLAEQADAMQVIAVQRAQHIDGVAPIVRKLRETVGKAHKAASSAANTAKLVELDDQVGDARMTLEMVRSAEKLCFSATHQALGLLYQVQTEVDRGRQEQQTLERSGRQAAEAADRARDAARDAVALARDLEARLGQGQLTVEAGRELVRISREHASTATAASVRSKQASQAASGQSRGAEAEREAQQARAAADEAVECLASIRRVLRQVDELDAEARDALASRVRSCIARARGAALSAGQSLERARIAASRATIPAGMDLLRAIEHYADAAENAARRCEARTAPVLADAGMEAGRIPVRRAIVEGEEAAEVAENQAREASTLSDRLVALAGEAAASAAELSKVQAEGQAMLQRVAERAEEVALAWRSLSEDTSEVTARTAREAIGVAQKAVSELERRVASIRADVEAIAAADEPSAVSSRIVRLRELEPELVGMADRARARCREARGAASRELEEIAARNAERRELDLAVERARDHARRCRVAVAAAWARYQETADILAKAPIDAADALRARAYEIIDIAEYQAGEAEAAANAASRQSDPADARSHASTAASFEERITEDLPEAVDLLDRARDLASEEIGRLREARERTTRASDDARDAVRTLEELRTAGRDAARGWSDDPSVAMALEQLELAASGLDEDHAEVRYAAERANQVESAEDALEMVPIAEVASRRLTAARSRGEAMAATLDAAVRTARHEVETREGAVHGVFEAVQGLDRVRATLTARSQRLITAVETHRASGDVVRASTTRMRAALDGTSAAEERVRDAARRVREAPTASEARLMQGAAEVALAEAERLLGDAAEAETEGIKAAEREAVEREASEQRQLEHARSAALGHVNTAKHAAEKGVAVLKEAVEQLTSLDDPEARRLHDTAQEWVRVARTAATGALKAARECQRAKTAVSAIDWEQRTAALAEDANRAVVEAHGLIRQAVDLARRADAEAKALASVKAEITSIRVMVEEGVQQAEADLLTIRAITSNSRDPDTLACASEGESSVQTVRRSAAKILAAAPLALQADSLDVAQGLLETCRMALERADEAADTVRELIQYAQKLKSEEADRAAARLAEARSAAERPAEEALAIAGKCADWVARGEGDVAPLRSPTTLAALAALKSASEEVQRLARQAETAAQPARRAPDATTAKAIGEKVREAADRAERAAERARDAREALRLALEHAAVEQRVAQEHRLQAAEWAAAAEVLAGDAATTAEELERYLTDAQIEDDDAARAFREVKRTAKSVAAAAAAAFEQTEAAMSILDPAGVLAAANAVDARRREAEGLLQELQQHDRRCREQIDEARRRTREDGKRRKDEALRAKLRQRRNESQILDRDVLVQRLEARDERNEAEQPNLSALRERLRARRKSGTADEPQRLERRTPARPEPDGDTNNTTRARRRRPSPDESSRLGTTGASPLPEVAPEPRTAEERAASRQRRDERRRRREDTPEPESRPERPVPAAPAPPAPTPRIVRPPSLDAPTRTEVGIITPGDVASSESADALLRRLRRNRKDDER